MNGYIEEGAWVSCSFDLAGKPQQLIRHLKREPNPVRYSSGNRLLTVVDLNTDKKFMCKLPAKQWGGLGALVGGLAIGVAIAVSGPVGLVVFAAVAITAVGTAVAVCLHDCAGPQSGGTWRSEHKKVLIKGEKPILYNKSVLACANGGLLIASESKPKAQAVSDNMKWQARGELGIQILSNALIGIFTGYMATKFADKDYSVFLLEPISYVVSDIGFPEFSPFQSAGVGVIFTALNFVFYFGRFIPGLSPTALNRISDFGTEFTKKDLGWAVLTTIGGYGADYFENELNESSKEVITTIESSQNDFSGKTIVAKG
ncbi:hypothetical protein ACFPZK_12725 [Psychrobacter urativorans]|uniref:hypothetical protein n=1 Tax=Psychrobacter urativorans TaxID=45610 RepID=UPI00191B268C|nr:hypothetical protein [Psychrobacter urativorans]